MSASDDSETVAALGCLFCGAPHGLKRVVERDDECACCGSPLFVAERQRLEYLGQRMLSRVPRKRLIDLYVTWPQHEPFTGEMRDLSLNGMRFAATIKLHPNQIVKIDCSVLGALARVAHNARDLSSVDQWVTGVEFLTLRFRRKSGTFVSARA